MFRETFGPEAPETKAARETYAAARLQAACCGIELRTLDATFEGAPPPGSEPGGLMAMALEHGSQGVREVFAGIAAKSEESKVKTSNSTVQGLGMDRCPHDPCMYSKVVDEDGSHITCPLYVDDGRQYFDATPAAVARAEMDRALLTERFGVKFGPIDPPEDYFLGANRVSNKSRSVVSVLATTYIEGMWERYCHGDMDTPTKEYPACWSHTPADEELTRAYEEAIATRTPADPKLFKDYNSLVGSLRHVVKYRPDISAAMDLLGCCLTFATLALLRCAYRVLVYLARTRRMGTTYSQHAARAGELWARADANWRTVRSTTGFVIFLSGAAILTCCRRQGCISMSTTEAELVALADCAIELIYMMSLLGFIGFVVKTPIVVETDNKGAYDLCHRYTSAQHTRHIDRKLFKMRELRGAEMVSVRHIPDPENTADMFTKILSRQPFEKHRKTTMNTAANITGKPGENACTSKPSTHPAACATSRTDRLPEFGGSYGDSDRTHDEIFDDAHDGHVFVSHSLGIRWPGTDPFDQLIMLAKARTSPDIYSQQQMRGPEWDEPKQVEVSTLERLGAFEWIAEDDERIRGWKAVDTMWTGRVKRLADRSVDKRKGRAVLRGDLHKVHYDVSANQAMAPVVRNTSLMAQEAVSCLRGQHMCSFDVTAAYLQGEQKTSEQVVARPPPGWSRTDERGVKLLWLMHSPLYGQLDAGAIWNRTFNDFVTKDGSPPDVLTSKTRAVEIAADMP